MTFFTRQKNLKEFTYRIAIDAFGIDDYGGGRSATMPLLKRLPLLMPDCFFYYFLSKYEKDLVFDNVKQIIFPLRKGIWARFLIQLIMPLYIFVNRINLIHFIKSQGSIVFNCKSILTIYDGTIIRYPEFFSRQSVLFWKHIQPYIAKKMDKIITISYNARDDIVDLLNIPLGKISVIYPSSQFEDLEVSRYNNIYNIEQLESGEDYLLFLGQIGLKKNLDTLIKAYSIIQKTEENFMKLILVGPRYSLSDAGEIFNLIKTLELNDKIIYLGPLSQSDLFNVLIKSKMLIFPSIHEGFGIPCLEAMQYGVPLIASNIPVIKEVVCDAAILIEDFLNPLEWARSIINLNRNENFMNELKTKGKNRAMNFSWDQSALILSNEYYRVLRGKINTMEPN